MKFLCVCQKINGRLGCLLIQADRSVAVNGVMSYCLYNTSTDSVDYLKTVGVFVGSLRTYIPEQIRV